MAEMDFSTLFGGRKKSERHEHDAYMTPPALVESIVERVSIRCVDFKDFDRPLRVLEPSCGDGEFVARCRSMWPSATIGAIDIRSELRDRIESVGGQFVNMDFLNTPPASIAFFDLIIGNPPYSLWEKFVEHALDGMRDGAHLAFLLRFNMLVASMDHQAWWTTPRANGLSPNRQLLVTYPIFPRPSFTGGGTDATEYMLAIWRKGHDNAGAFEPVKWNKPPARRGRRKKSEG